MIIGGSFMVGPFLDILLIEGSKPPLVPHLQHYHLDVVKHNQLYLFIYLSIYLYV